MSRSKHAFKRQYLPKDMPLVEKRRIIAHRWYHRHRKQAAAIRRAWQKKNPEKLKGFWVKYRDRVREQLFNLYGNKCVRCRFSDPRAFQLDHIEGSKEPRGHPYRGGWRLYAAIVRGHRDAKEFQLLCANCNAIKMWEKDEIHKNHNGLKKVRVWDGEESCLDRKHQLGGKIREVKPVNSSGLRDSRPQT